MDCCCSGVQTTKETLQNICNGCGNAGRVVTYQTVAHHVKSENLGLIDKGEYKFCSSRDCPVVYYSTSGRTFAIEDVREPVTSKNGGDGRPLCYCFGFTEGHVRREIEQTGRSSTPSQVAQFIRNKLCACEVRNPSGACCLGQLNEAVKRLTEKSLTAAEPWPSARD